MEADRLVPQPAAGEAVAAPTPPPQAAAAHDQDHMAGGDEPSTLPASTATVLRKIQKWWDYKSAGDVIAGSRLIPMKTPLTRELQARPARLEATARARSGSVDGSGGGGGVAPGQEPAGEQREHTIGGFIAEQAAQGRTVGLIVDLSNHESLYADDLARECPGLAYQHFHFVAKEVPDREGCQRVARCITAYLHKHPEHYAGIHCSYGFNRTGLVCCAYLCEELGFSVDQALAAFAAARPPGVKHQHFIDALRARYGSPPTADVEISPATTLASACSSGGSPAAVRAAGGKGDDDDGGSAAPAPTVAAAATPAVAAAEGIIPPPRNNETLGGDVREAILAALQLHQQEQEQEQGRGSDVGSQRQPSSLRSCGGVGCVVS